MNKNPIQPQFLTFQLMLLALNLLTDCQTFTTPHRLIRIAEGTMAGTVLIRDLMEFLGESTYTETHNAGILAIGNAAVPGVNWFAIDSKSHSLVVKTPPDRDILCPEDSVLPGNVISTEDGGIQFLGDKPDADGAINNCIVQISLLHGPATNPNFDVISIVLEDINDHAPEFFKNSKHKVNNSYFEIKIPEINEAKVNSNENKETDLRVPLPLATDEDSGANALCGYRLEGLDAHLFHLQFSPPVRSPLNVQPKQVSMQSIEKGGRQVNQLWLVPSVKGSPDKEVKFMVFDREKRPEYNFLLVAYDCGIPQRSSRLPIKILIEDVNDHAPVFNDQYYFAEITENERPGQKVLDLAAHDLDMDYHNGKISFNIPGYQTLHQGTNHGSSIGISSSQLAAANLFDIEQNFDHSLKEKASVELQEPNLTTGKLIVRVQSQDRWKEAMEYAISVAKNNPVNIGISKMQHYIPTNTSIGLNTNYKVNLIFEIEACDQGRPVPICNRVPVQIVIVRINSKPPTIFVSYIQPGHNNEWGRVIENLSPSMLAQMTVIDEDDPLGRLDILCITNDRRFTLTEIANYDQIREDSWQSSHKVNKRIRRDIHRMKIYKLMVNTPLDREVNKKHPSFEVFGVTCSDNSQGYAPGGQLSSQVTIRLLVEDINDNPPIFDKPHYIFHAPENLPTEFTTSGMKEGNSYLIGSVHATDADEGFNAAIEYKLVSNPASAIEINPKTGQLFVTKPFDREVTNEVLLQILAIDCHGCEAKNSIRMTSTTEARLIIDDVNDCPPIFTEMNYHFEVEEGVDLVKVGQVKATDMDQGESGRIVYRIVTELMKPHTHAYRPQFFTKLSDSVVERKQESAMDVSKHFQIDPITGLIRLKSRLDRELTSHYEFYVFAVDNPMTNLGNTLKQAENLQFTSSATVLVTVLDRNDNPPRIVNPRNHAEYILGPEQLIAGNTIFTIEANDPDLGENGTLEFEMTHVERIAETRRNNLEKEGNFTKYEKINVLPQGETINNSPFAIDRTAGICYLRENLPSLGNHVLSSYMLYVRVYDLGKPISLNTSLIVRVTRQTIDYISKQSKFQNIGDKFPVGEYMKHDVADETDDRIHSWPISGTGRITDRSMIVILSSVFVLLLLTAVVLLLLVRYRRLFTRSGWSPNRSPGEKSLNKDQLFKKSQYANGKHGSFPEVVAAPWVNNDASPVGSPTLSTYPTFYNHAGGNLGTSGTCIRNPGACWSPLGTVQCLSPSMRRCNFSDVKPNRQFLYGYNSVDIEMVRRNPAIGKEFELIPVSAFERDNLNDTVLENLGSYQSAHDKSTRDNRMISNSREESTYNKLDPVFTEELHANALVRSMQDSQISSVQDSSCTAMSRLASSLEELNNKKEFIITANGKTYQEMRSRRDRNSHYEAMEKYSLSPMRRKLPIRSALLPNEPRSVKNNKHLAQFYNSDESREGVLFKDFVVPQSEEKLNRTTTKPLHNFPDSYIYRKLNTSDPFYTHRDSKRYKRKRNLILRFANELDPFDKNYEANNLEIWSNPNGTSVSPTLKPIKLAEIKHTSSLPSSPNKTQADICVQGSFV